jgi:hypothetical protein
LRFATLVPIRWAAVVAALVPSLLVACGSSPEDARRRLEARMRTPCLYVGEWQATRPGADYLVTLQADGRFAAVPANGRGQEFRGTWGVVDGDKMVWTYDGSRKREINPIEPVIDDVFDMVEDDKSKTHYVRTGRGGAC